MLIISSLLITCHNELKLYKTINIIVNISDHMPVLLKLNKLSLLIKYGEGRQSCRSYSLS